MAHTSPFLTTAVKAALRWLWRWCRCVVQVIQSSRGMSLEQIRDAIVGLLVPLLQHVESLAKEIAGATGMKYFGIDASLAPHPEHPDHSVAHMIELLGVDRCGGNGTVLCDRVFYRYYTGAARETVASVQQDSTA